VWAVNLLPQMSLRVSKEHSSGKAHLPFLPLEPGIVRLKITEHSKTAVSVKSCLFKTGRNGVPVVEQMCVLSNVQ
jgi:hypothetical protein